MSASVAHPGGGGVIFRKGRRSHKAIPVGPATAGGLMDAGWLDEPRTVGEALDMGVRWDQFATEEWDGEPLFTSAADAEARRDDSLAEARCRVCGCTDDAACTGGCWWVPDPQMGELCSACQGKE